VKPTVGFFEFSCCEGCKLQILEMEDQLLDILSLVDIVEGREIMDDQADHMTIAFVEGSITRESEIPRLEEIRGKCDLLIAIGACATMGGVNAIKNRHKEEDVRSIVYGDKAHLWTDTIPTRPLSECVKVDYELQGCPVNGGEFLSVVKALLTGQTPHIKDYPQCMECKLKENVCLFDKGEMCLGPVVRAGCDVICPTLGQGCEGCRGLISNPNLSAQIDVLAEHGLTVKDVLDNFTLFGNYPRVERRLGISTSES
jgi:sulfhydrogenase subunit delta